MRLRLRISEPRQLADEAKLGQYPRYCLRPVWRPYLSHLDGGATRAAAQKADIGKNRRHRRRQGPERPDDMSTGWLLLDIRNLATIRHRHEELTDVAYDVKFNYDEK